MSTELGDGPQSEQPRAEAKPADSAGSNQQENFVRIKTVEVR
jgi:hypothetical protein